MTPQQLTLPLDRLPEAQIRGLFEEVFRQLKPRTPLPPIAVEFYPYASLNHSIRRRSGRVLVRLSDIMRDAQPADLEAIAAILICKLYRRTIPEKVERRYRRYANQPEVRDRIHEVRRRRSRPSRGRSKGRTYDLHLMLEAVARKYHVDLANIAKIYWTPTVSRSVLGRYDRAHYSIAVNRALDHPDIPAYFVEYIVYHEMLHSVFDDVFEDDTRRSHHAAFRAAEKRFTDYEKSQKFLKSISRWISGRRWTVD
ncbi:MAG: hypothetical protein ACR2L2_20035 [Acidobacteriota bacterium]